MVEGRSDPSDGSRRISPSDPAVVADAALPWDLEVAYQRFGLEVDGTIGPTSWAELELLGAAVFRECGLTPAGTKKPLFEGHTGRDPIAELGYGHMVGEGDLRVGSKGFFGVRYSSFVATILLWVQPALPKHALDRPDVPHTWMARVGAGRVVSADTVGKHGRYRMYRGRDQVEPGYEWVPRTILNGLNRTAT